MAWLDPEELRIGLGCLRLPADEAAARETIVTAARCGVTVFDTAHAYGPKPGCGERLLARALGAGVDPGARVRIVTKGGMTRPGGAWLPDGRARTIAADCEASLAALGGRPIDLYLLHAPDPRTAWRTSIRALGRLVEQGLVARVGVANVNRTQLDEAVGLAPITAVQVALSVLDDRAIAGGLLERCADLGITLIAHSPLGGPRRAGTLDRRPALCDVAGRRHGTPAEVALAWLLSLSPAVIAIPGAGRPESARSAARAGTLELGAGDRDELTKAFGASRSRTRTTQPRAGVPAPRTEDGEVVIVMGIPGAGKSRVAADYLQRGYARLNRDERGGSLRALAAELDEQLAGGTRYAVLDNTYLTRESRSRVIEVAARHHVVVRCVWVDTPLAQAQVNLVLRLLERFDRLPTPEQIRAAARREPWLMPPTSQMRALRELEPPASDEGFTAVERLPFTRIPTGGATGPTVLVGADAAMRDGLAAALLAAAPAAPHLLFGWTPEGATSVAQAAFAELRRIVTGPVEIAVCPHAGGPPRCWCRPPLPGLPLAFAHAYSVDLTQATLIGCTPAHRTLARTLDAHYVSL